MASDYEVFNHPGDYDLNEGMTKDDFHYKHGWYFWFCIPGCLPDSDPYGPFVDEEAANYEAQMELAEDEDEEETPL
jgi:hypothetical protein